MAARSKGSTGSKGSNAGMTGARGGASSTSRSATGTSNRRGNGSAAESIHVIPHREGWAVRLGDRTRAHRVFGTKKEAEDLARDMAQRRKSELVVQKSDGTIHRKDSHGNDPHPPKG